MTDYRKDLKAARAIHGHTQQVAANNIGVTHSTYNKWERARRIPAAGLQRQAADRYIKAARRLIVKTEGAGDVRPD